MKYLLAKTSALILSCAVFVSPALAEPVVLKFASAFPQSSKTNSVSIPAFIKAVEEASEGTLKIEHYPGGTLGSNPATQLKLIEDGVVDMAEVVASYTPGRFVELEMFELPFNFNDTKEASLTALKLYQDGHLSGFDNIELIGIAEVGPYYLQSKAKIETAKDIAGKKIRAGGPIQGAIIQAMGGVAVGGMPATQIAENISRNVINSTLMDMGNLYNFRISDTAKYHVTNAPMGNVAVMFPMNKEKYNSLPEKAKAALDKHKGEWFTTVLAENIDLQNAETTDRLSKDSKHTFVELSDSDVELLKGKFEPLKARWDSEQNGKNLFQEMIAGRDALRAKN